MIYASLTTIRAWNEPLVPPVYLVLALATGGILYSGLAAMARAQRRRGHLLTILLLVAGWVMKALYWSRIDGRQLTLTTADAHRASRRRHRAPHRGAAHPGQFRDARDGLRRRPAACRQPAH